MAAPPIPYFTTSRYRVATMVELAHAKPGERVADLGTGDGRIAIAFGEKGIEADGYEIDPDRIKLARENSKNSFGSAQDKAAFGKIVILDKDFWQEDLSKYDIVCCYPMPTIMGRLEKKLKEELKPGARVLLNYFPFPHWKEKIIKDNIYLYIK